MTSHPSVEGLREVVSDAIAGAPGDPNCHRCPHARAGCCWEHRGDFVLKAQADYLREHGVLLGAEGLLRAKECGRWHSDPGRCNHPDGFGNCTNYEGGERTPMYRLAPIPQDGES